MSSVALSGADTISINTKNISDLADGNCVELTFPNDIAQVKTGKNGNSLYSLNESGKQCEVKIRVVRGSDSDKFLLGLLSAQQNDFASTVLMIGEFIKKIGNGISASGATTATVSSDTYIMSGGVFTKQVEAKMNVEGDTEQSVSIYTMKFSNSPRVIA